MHLDALSSEPLNIIGQRYHKSLRKKYLPWNLVCVSSLCVLCEQSQVFFRKDTPNYCGCYSCRHACMRCHRFLL